MYNNHIAVLIINRNDYRNTKECLDSLIKNNKDSNYSIIIIDNGSKD
ncbi:glycosyltransferase [bacterium]|nr:glycosyltransferase [bacterium]